MWQYPYSIHITHGIWHHSLYACLFELLLLYYWYSVIVSLQNKVCIAIGTLLISHSMLDNIVLITLFWRKKRDGNEIKKTTGKWKKVKIRVITVKFGRRTIALLWFATQLTRAIIQEVQFCSKIKISKKKSQWLRALLSGSPGNMMVSYI